MGRPFTMYFPWEPINLYNRTRGIASLIHLFLIKVILNLGETVTPVLDPTVTTFIN